MIKTLMPALFIISLASGEIFNGMTLFSVIDNNGSGDTYYTLLIDNEKNEIKRWTHPRGVASMPYLLPDSTLLYPYRVQNPSMNAGGVGGGISKYSWDGQLQWNYEIANDIYQLHHDIEPLPNGNILVLAWERKTANEAFGIGRQTIDNPLNEMWSEAILELELIGSNNANIVWEWHLWDHLIQDMDPELPNYGVVADHPELQDINYGNVGSMSDPLGPNGDWKHLNSIDYNEELDQIIISSRHHDEIYIIDHSTTTEEAASDYGGNSGKGGNYLYRWGNPQTYGRGDESNHLLSVQHGVNWVQKGFPGSNNIIIYNNEHWMGTSAVYEIIPPINQGGNYDIEDNEPYGPDDINWLHTGDFHSLIQGGAFRLSNGNTLITATDNAYIFEVTSSNEIVWEYNFGSGDAFIARAQKYPTYYLNGVFSEYNIGDINFDGNYSLMDILIITDMLLGYNYLSTPPADLNQDGMVDQEDIEILINDIIN